MIPSINNGHRLSVHIVAWNSMTFLPSLFSTLDEQGIGFRTIVVDNASTDGVASWLSSERPHVTVLRNMRNSGFARAHNQAIQLALSGWQGMDLSERYILICNPDIEMDANCLQHLVAYMDANSEIDACTPKLLRAYLRSSDMEHIVTERTRLIDATGLSITRSRRTYDRGSGEPDQGQYDMDNKIFGTGGACACIRASSVISAYENNMFFDEDFSSYKEDVDVAWRMRRLGMQSAYVPQAVAWHHRSAPSGSGSWFSSFFKRRKKPLHINYLSSRNHLWLLVKHLASSDLLIHAPWIIAYETAKICAAVFSWSSVRGYVAAFYGLPRMLAKRKELKKRARLSAREIRSWCV